VVTRLGATSALARRYRRFARAYGELDPVPREIGRRLESHLDPMRIHPHRIVDLGCGNGADIRALERRYPKSRVTGLDLVADFLAEARRKDQPWFKPARATLCADLSRMPIADGAVDLLYANLSLLWPTSWQNTLAEFRRVLGPGGLLLFSAFGPDTLRELREHAARADGFLQVHEFADMHDLGDQLSQSGYRGVVMEAEHLTVYYPTLRALLHELRIIGAGNRLPHRPRGLLGKARFEGLRQHYERLRTDQGLPVTLEVIYAHAWTPEARVSVAVPLPLPVTHHGPRKPR